MKRMNFFEFPLGYWFLLVILDISIALPAPTQDDEGIYNIGVGWGDITGPPAGVVLNGHVRPTLGSGIHTRQHAKAFIIESKRSGNIVAFVTCDMGMIDHSMKSEIVQRLHSKYGSKFNQANIMISGTHTHSGVSGFMTYYTYLAIESYGFNPVSYWAVVEGIAEAIDQAASSLEDGHIFYSTGQLLQANRNRRRDQYDMNPQEERDRYEFDVDKEMIMLKLEGVEGNSIGAFFWFPFHPLSFNRRETNPLVCSEGGGYAGILFDKEMNSGNEREKVFVSAFASSNLGDVAPENEPPVEGRIDLDNDREQLRNHGGKLYRKAMELFNNATVMEKITGSIDFAHQYVNSDTVQVDVFNTTSNEMETLSLCKPALGFGYVGLDPDFPFLEEIRDLIKVPSLELVECQLPKIIALAAGEMDSPWPWAPLTFELQAFKIGSVLMTGLPGEFTTMAGRRVKDGVESVSPQGSKVILSGLTNNYINYVATPEEYDFQEYEAGATIYGRNTLPVIIALFENMTRFLIEENGDQIEEGEEPPTLIDFVRKEIPQRADSIPENGLRFGDVIVDANLEYELGTDSQVNVTFIAGSPRNSGLRKGTFLTVEKFENATNSWVRHRTDADIDTIFYWKYLEQRAEIVWFLDEGNVQPGLYRIRHFGYYKLQVDGLSVNYLGVTRSFTIV